MFQMDAFNRNDTVVQMSRCSFDIHIQDIMGTLLAGATVVMLHPRGNMDFEYLVKTMKSKQISCISIPYQVCFTVISLFYNGLTLLMLWIVFDQSSVVVCTLLIKFIHSNNSLYRF